MVCGWLDTTILEKYAAVFILRMEELHFYAVEPQFTVYPHLMSGFNNATSLN